MKIPKHNERYAAIAATVGTGLAMVAIASCTQLKHPAIPEPKPITAKSTLSGCSNIKVSWMWPNAPASVEIEVSRDGTNWLLLSKQQAATGSNATYVLIPVSYLIDTNSTPYMRIGTAERRRSFSIPNTFRGM